MTQTVDFPLLQYTMSICTFKYIKSLKQTPVEIISVITQSFNETFLGVIPPTVHWARSDLSLLSLFNDALPRGCVLDAVDMGI